MLQPTYAPRRSRGRRRKLRTWPIVVLLAAPLTYLFVWRTPTSAPIGIDSASATIPDMEEERGPTAPAQLGRVGPHDVSYISGDTFALRPAHPPVPNAALRPCPTAAPGFP